MHETFMAQQIVEELLRITQPHRPTRITAVALKVGVLRQVVDELLGFALRVAAQETVAGDAQWGIEHVPARCRCNSCQSEFAVEGWVYQCPDCGSNNVRNLNGDELIIESVTMETEEEQEQAQASSDEPRQATR